MSKLHTQSLLQQNERHTTAFMQVSAKENSSETQYPWLLLSDDECQVLSGLLGSLCLAQTKPLSDCRREAGLQLILQHRHSQIQSQATTTHPPTSPTPVPTATEKVSCANRFFQDGTEGPAVSFLLVKFPNHTCIKDQILSLLSKDLLSCHTCCIMPKIQ